MGQRLLESLRKAPHTSAKAGTGRERCPGAGHGWAEHRYRRGQGTVKGDERGGRHAERDASQTRRLPPARRLTGPINRPARASPSAQRPPPRLAARGAPGACAPQRKVEGGRVRGRVAIGGGSAPCRRRRARLRPPRAPLTCRRARRGSPGDVTAGTPGLAGRARLSQEALPTYLPISLLHLLLLLRHFVVVNAGATRDRRREKSPAAPPAHAQRGSGRTAHSARDFLLEAGRCDVTRASAGSFERGEGARSP